jgi:hypothetical protein
MTATAIINKATQTRITKTMVKVIMTNTVVTPNKGIIKVVMDIMTNRMFPAARRR